MTRAELEALYNNKPGAAIEDAGGGEEYQPVSTVDVDISRFRKDEADEEEEALR